MYAVYTIVDEGEWKWNIKEYEKWSDIFSEKCFFLSLYLQTKDKN